VYDPGLSWWLVGSDRKSVGEGLEEVFLTTKKDVQEQMSFFGDEMFADDAWKCFGLLLAMRESTVDMSRTEEHKRESADIPELLEWLTSRFSGA
jgi:hypothetical protein